MTAPPAALITGTGHFELPDLSLFADEYTNGVVADQKTPTAGHVRIDRVRMRLNRYRRHITPEVAAVRCAEVARISGGDALRIAGEDVEVSGCDIYCAGRPIFLSRASRASITDNHFYIGRSGWYCLSGLNGLLFERNIIEGDDLMSGGGGMNTLDETVESQDAYYAHNTIRNFYGGDHEGMTTDGSSGIYYGKITSASGVHLALADDIKTPAWRSSTYWTGCGVFIMSGNGQGQYRRLKSIDGRIFYHLDHSAAAQLYYGRQLLHRYRCGATVLCFVYRFHRGGEHECAHCRILQLRQKLRRWGSAFVIHAVAWQQHYRRHCLYECPQFQRAGRRSAN